MYHVAPSHELSFIIDPPGSSLHIQYQTGRGLSITSTGLTITFLTLRYPASQLDPSVQRLGQQNIIHAKL